MRAVGMMLCLAACDGGTVNIDDTGKGADTDPVEDTDATSSDTDAVQTTWADEGCGSTRAPTVHDPFAEAASVYPIGSPTAYPWNGEDFETYSHDQLVEDDQDLSAADHLDVVRGVLKARHAGAWKRGWSDGPALTLIARQTSGSLRVGWSDVEASANFSIDTWKGTADLFSGPSVIVRYQTDDDFYFATLRKDGDVSIKRKHCGEFTTLATDTFGTVNTSQWYSLALAVEGTTLTAYVDDQAIVTVDDEALSWGSAGWLNHGSDLWLDALVVSEPR